MFFSPFTVVSNTEHTKAIKYLGTINFIFFNFNCSGTYKKEKKKELSMTQQNDGIIN